jgi:glycosidase
VIAWLWIVACRPPAAPPPERPEPRAPATDVLYFALVDRFADGQPDPEGSIDRADPQAWHGGDLKGVLDRLEHLEQLGVGALWLSPITAARTDKIDEWGAYHGYWVRDLGEVEPRFGTWDDVRALSDALHARGMRLYLDMVYNHVGYDVPLVTERPEWFHGRGDVTDWNDPDQLVNHDVHGLPDLAVERDDVYAFLRERSLRWIEAADPDGFRVDAVRHLPEGFLARLGDDLRAAAGDDFELLGEVFDGDPGRLAARAAADRLDAVFDFPLHYAIRDTYCADGPVGRVAAPLSVEDYGGARPVTLLDNHDTPRILATCKGDRGRVAQALALLLTARGQPSLTWGTEIGLDGEHEPDNRADMRWDAPPDPLADTLRHLLRWRADAVLRQGDTRVLHLERDVLVFARTLGERGVIVTVNAGSEPADASPRPDVTVTERVIVAGAGAPVAADEGPVPAGATRLERVEGPFPEAPGTVAFQVQLAEPAALKDGQRLLMVGAHPAIGGWDATRGVAAEADTFTVEVEAGGVLEFKLVVAEADGTFTWEQRDENRYLLVGPSPARIEQ